MHGSSVNNIKTLSSLLWYI